MNKLILGTAVILSAAGAFAADWYVDDALGSDTTGTGTSANPYKTIQAAIEAETTQADDTIWIRPGVYDEVTRDGLAWSYSGKATGAYSANNQTRVLVTKKLTFRGTDPTDKPVILGSHGDPDRTSNGDKSIAYRLDSIGCVLIKKAALGSTFRDLVLRDGNVHQSCASGYASGGICCEAPRTQGNFTLIDCTLEGCYGRYGGAMHGGVAIRCTFRGNRTTSQGAVAYGAKLYNCFLFGNSPDNTSRADLENCIAVNCLAVNNFQKYGFGGHAETGAAETDGAGVYYNCVSFANYVQSILDTELAALSNCCVVGSYAYADAATRNMAATEVTNACVSPLSGDCRPVKAGFCDGTGVADYITAVAASFVPADELAIAFDGQPYDLTASVPIGLLLPAVEVKSGVLELSTVQACVNGYNMAINPVYLQSATYPADVRLAGSSKIRPKWAYFSSSTMFYRGLDADGNLEDAILQQYPPKGQSFSLYPVECENELYVDAASTAETPDGTSTKPYPTIQQAVDAVTDNTRTLIHVAKGHYKTGFSTAGTQSSHPARVVIPAQRVIVIRADKGPSETFIEGAADTTDSADATTGCGPNAVRCVDASVSANCCFVGFTFRYGHAAHCTGSTNSQTDYGGAVIAGNSFQVFSDCIFEENAGTVACCRNGWYVRCTFRNNSQMVRGLISSSGSDCAVLSSCLFVDNMPEKQSGISYLILENSVAAFNTTICETYGSSVQTYNINCSLYNCVVLAPGYTSRPQVGTGYAVGSILHSSVAANNNHQTGTYSTYDLLEYGNSTNEPFFASMARADYRLTSDSPSVAGVTSAAGGNYTQKSFLWYMRTTRDNRSLIQDDGSILPGCYRDIYVKRGIYVSPDGSDTANDGRSEDAPYQTLQKAVDEAADYGEEALALPGTYNLGAEAHVGLVFNNNNNYTGTTVTNRSRVVIREGVTLRALGDVAETIIEGADAEADDPTRDENGLGATALRCAFLEKGAVLDGFTLRNGRTTSVNATTYYDDNLGGAVLGRSIAGTRVKNCVLTGNRSRNGGAGSHVTFDHCKIVNNIAYNAGSVFRTGSMFDCYAIGNTNGRICDIYQEIVNCTFRNNTDSKGNAAYLVRNSINQNARVVNTVAFDCNKNATEDSANSVKGLIANCVFPAGTICTNRANLTYTNIDTSLSNDELNDLIDENGRPTCCTAPFVDAGSTDGSTAETDLDGTARVKNGTIDIGCYEYDWKDDYGVALGKRVKVTQANAGVVETEGTVTLSDGGSLAATWQPAVAGGCRHEIKVTLTGEGTLTVLLNGVALGTVTTSGTLDFSNANELNALTFAYAGTGSATIDSLKCKTGLILLID